MNSKEYIKREKMIMDMEYSIITNYIKLRKNAKISQEQLANETNVIRTTIARIENNMNSPQLKTMLELLEPLYENNIANKPNLVTDIFKVRSGEWTQVRIWSKMNLGTLKKEDLFITNSRLEPIEGFFEREEYEIKNWDEEEDKEYKELIQRLEDGEVID